MNMSLAWRLNFPSRLGQEGVRRVTWENIMWKLRCQGNPSCSTQHLAVPVQQYLNVYKSFRGIVYLKAKPQISNRGFPALNCFHQALLTIETLKCPRKTFLNFLCCFSFLPRILSPCIERKTLSSGAFSCTMVMQKRLKIVVFQQPDKFSNEIQETK